MKNEVGFKKYYCPLCGYAEMKNTNHYGEIYTPCKNCENRVLYCSEGTLGEPEAECLLVTYEYNLTNPFERDQYLDMCCNLQRTTAPYKARISFKMFEYLKMNHGRLIRLYNVKQFNQQYVSDIGRVHSWFETIWDNRNFKGGYYLDFFRY